MFIHKLKAFSIHLLLSFLTLSLFFGLLIFLWFPEPYFTATGGWQGLKLVAIVDLVLGPLLTFIVYNPLKKTLELKRDLGVIIALQLVVLFGGIYTVYTQRPVAIVFWQDSFKTVSASEINNQYIHTEIYNDINSSPLQFYVVNQPTSVKAKQNMLKLISKYGIAPHQQLNLYQKLNDNHLTLSQHSINIIEIAEKSIAISKQLNNFLLINKSKVQDYLYVPLLSKYQNTLLIFNQKQEFITYIKISL